VITIRGDTFAGKVGAEIVEAALVCKLGLIFKKSGVQELEKAQ
jgi:hypothetical protein